MSAEELAGSPIHEAYACVGCSQPLVARVNGALRRPHFAHKVQVACNPETYLHRLAKEVFSETYRACLANDTPFTITLPTPRVCKKFTHLLDCFSELGEENREIDLTQYYRDIAVETREGSFIPDLSLRIPGRPEDTLFVEIAVSHFLSSTKAESGHRIVEIPIRREEDIEIIRSARLDSTSASFVGFAPPTGLLTDSECLCATQHVLAFFLFESGKAHLERTPVRALAAELKRRKVVYYNVLRDDADDASNIGSFGRSRGSLFVDQVYLARNNGAPIRNCYLCRYHGDNWEPVWNDNGERHGIFCKYLKKTCTSNEAVGCQGFRLQRPRSP